MTTRVDLAAVQAAIDRAVRPTRPPACFRLELGQIVATPGAMALPINRAAYLERHRACDWGEVSLADAMANDDAIRSKDQILSSYQTPGGRLWIVTEWPMGEDRPPVTTLLLPEER